MTEATPVTPAPTGAPPPPSSTPAPVASKTELTSPPPAAPAGGEAPKDAPKEGEAPKDAAPAADITLKLPDGFDVKDPLLTGFTALAKEAGLKPEVAQKMADLYVQRKQEEVKQQQERWTTQAQDWITGAKADKEYGGEKFTANLDIARKALTRFGSEPLGALLDTTALGNHPEVIRFFVRVGKALAEDSVAGTTGTGAGAAPANDEEARLRVMYPKMFQEK
jgi:hypothetical protein